MTYRGSIQWESERLSSLLHEKCVSAAEMIGAAAMNASYPYVPYDTGRLSSSARYVRGVGGDDVRGEILWETPYASCVYYGDQRGVSFSREHHPHATARWFETAKSMNLADWKQKAAQVIGGKVR